MHGVASGLSAGSHTAKVQYYTHSGTVYLPHQTTDAGENYYGLSAKVVPSANLVTTASFPTASAYGTSSTWASLPTPLSISFTTTSDDAVMILADLSRVQHSTINVNTAFRIIVDGSDVVAYSNTADAYSWAYDAISMHGVARGLRTGTHTAEVQYYTERGIIYIPYNSYAGENYVRLTACAVHNSQLVSASTFPSASYSGTSTSWATHRDRTTALCDCDGERPVWPCLAQVGSAPRGAFDQLHDASVRADAAHRGPLPRAALDK